MPCEEMTFERSSPSLVTTAAHVSSQLVSSARMSVIAQAVIRGHGTDDALGTSSSRPASVDCVRHMTTASSPLSW